jgi:hypothetical protein
VSGDQFDFPPTSRWHSAFAAASGNLTRRRGGLTAPSRRHDRRLARAVAVKAG